MILTGHCLDAALQHCRARNFKIAEGSSGLRGMPTFLLAGGTALSLHLGHRISIDLDLFTQDQFNSNALFESLRDSEVFEILLQVAHTQSTPYRCFSKQK